MMCSLERIGRVFVLRLVGENEQHRLNPSVCSEIIAALDTVEKSDAGALVTTADGKFFSNGLDLDWVHVDKERRGPEQSDAFEQLIFAFMKLSIPTVAAICGHASAGGFILAMAHDHRLMRGDRGFLYMSEIDVNVVIPPRLMELLTHKMEPRVLKETILKGLRYTGTMALKAGLVDSVHQTASDTFEAAVEEASKLAGRNWSRSVYLGLRMGMHTKYFLKMEAKHDQRDQVITLAKL